MCTYVSTHFHCQFVGLPNGLARQDGGRESAAKRVAGSYGVGNLHLGRFLKVLQALCKHVAAIRSAGQHDHVEVVFAENQPALVLNVETRIVKKTIDDNKLFIVNSQDVASLKRLLDNLSGVEVAMQVDVKNLQSVVRSGIEKFSNGRSRLLTALGQ